MRGNWVQRLLTATKNANAMELPFPGEDIAIAGKTEKVSFDKFFRDKTKESSSRVREIELLSLDTNNSTTSDRKTHKTLSGKNSFENDLKIHFNRDSSNIKTTGDRSQPIIPKPERDLHIDRPGKVKSESPKEALEEPFSSGVFVVGESGEVGFDFLFDGGKHKSELAIFSLEGMEDIEFGSTTFIREATSRALDRSSLGHVVIRDRTEGAKFDGKLEGKNWNKGEHKGVKMFQMNPGDRFGIMLIPNGTVKQIHKNPNSKGAKKPLFSLATEGNDFGQIADINGKGHTFAMEDVQPEHKGFDRDYNDIIFQVSGATAQTQSLDNAIDPQKDWRGTDVGQEIVQYIEENDPNRPNLPIDPGTGSPYKPGELLIKFAANTSNAEIQKLANDYGAIAFENLVPFDPDSDSPLQQWRLFRFDPNSDLLPIREAISEENGIESLEFNAVRYLSWTPNDPDYEYLWGLNNKNRPDVDINVEQAWDIQRGSKNINVAVIDTGIDYNHLDLHENMWRNLGEIAGNGIDDDGNGYIDDIYGYDFGNGDSDPIPDRFAWYDFEFGHGTHVAGTVGAVGDNDKGIIGVSPNVSLMALNIRDTLASLHESKSVLTLDAIAKSINYAVNNGADIINASFEGPNHFSLEYDAIQYANNKGVVVVAAAGNQSKNNDIHGVYPANYSQNFSNVISVAATNDRDELWGNSNYGALSVDLGAPGEGIYSTMPGNLYDGSSGTSMAAPHVAGAAALLLAENPSLTPEEIKNILLDTGDSLAALQGKTVSGKRLNLYKALKAVVQAEETSVYKIGNEFQINTETEKGQWGASVAALDDGGFVVTWTSWEQDGVQGGIYGQRYDRNGNKVKGEFQINTTTFQMQTGANIKTLNDGTFVVTWHSFEQDGSDEAIIGRRYDAEGNALTDEFQINTRSQFDQEWPDIAALVDGGFVVVWHADEDGNNGYAAYGQRYNSAGEKVGDEFRANTHNENEQIVPRVAVLNDGGFVVAWWSKQQDSNGDGVYAQRYGSDGELLGEEFRVNTEILYNERDPAIVALNDGGFFIAWVSNYGNNGIFNGVRGQRYDANGDAVGDELQLSDASTGQYTRWPKLTSLQDGGFVATWESWSDGEVYGRRFSANGTAIGEQFRVNDYTDGAQNGGEMATLKDGNFVVTWASEGQDGDDMGVYGRIFEVTDAIAPTIVTNTNDSGEGSLRAALEWANANLGRDTITFDIPITDPGYNATTGTFTIQPLTALPEIKDPAILNATTQDQFTNTPIVELDGSLAGNSQGFRMVTSDSKIQGFVINHFEIGLTLYGNNNKIQGNFIGTDVTGTKILGNSIDGIRILGSNNWIGGIIEGSENLISGNQHGVKIQSNDNIIQGNLIGTDITGTKILGNDYNGITIEQGTNNLIGGTIERSENLISGNQNGVKIQSNDNIIQGNLIGTDIAGNKILGNDYNGIVIEQGTNNLVGGTIEGSGNLILGNQHGVKIRSSDNIIQGNLIGTDITGTKILGNDYNGIDIEQGTNNLIGGATEGSKNLISGNQHGVKVWSNDNIIQGNLIGTDITGTQVLGNSYNGITLEQGTNNLIGGTTEGSENLISGNQNGVKIRSGGNIIQGNLIGTNITGTQVLGNSYNGIDVEQGANNLIGGTTEGSENLISGNQHGVKIRSNDNIIQGNSIGTDITGTQILGNSYNGIIIEKSSNNMIGGTIEGSKNLISGNQHGVKIEGEEATKNSILGNSIFPIFGRGIDLDQLAQNQIKSPTLSLAQVSNNNTIVQGTLNHASNQMFRLEFFSNPQNNNGGQTFLGYQNVTTDGNGDASFNVSLLGVTAGQFVTATATDAEGNTSEFSDAIRVDASDTTENWISFFHGYRYLSFNDNPFDEKTFTTFHLENFEDGLLNTPGVSVDNGKLHLHAQNRDSVDSDDGQIDGSGSTGESWLIWENSLTFTFDDAILGGFPTHAGVVWTDGVGGTVIVEAFDANGNSLGSMNGSQLISNSEQGNTDEDRFFGAVYNSGISALKLIVEDGNTIGGWEVDHLQYGIAEAQQTPPAPQTAPLSPSVFHHLNHAYNSLQDSPLLEDGMQVETFEDGALDTLGVTASTGFLAPSSHSIEENGNSWQVNQESLAFTFDEDVLGALPTRAGVAVTDIANADIGTIALETFDSQGISLGVTEPQALGTGDRFFGVEYEGGISQITLTTNSNSWNIDHLQYG